MARIDHRNFSTFAATLTMLASASACTMPDSARDESADADELRYIEFPGYPAAECIPPVPRGPIYLGAGTIAPKLFVDLEPGQHHVIQFRDVPSKLDEQTLSEHGVVLLDPVPDNAWFAWIDPKAEIEDAAWWPMAGGITHAFPLTEAHKLHPYYAAANPAKPAAKGPPTAALHWFPNVPEHERTLPKAANLELVQRIGDTDVVAGELDEIVSLSKLAGLRFIEPVETEHVEHSRAGEIAHNASSIYAPPWEITGSGVSVAVFDAGWADEDHPDLLGRVSHDASLLDWRGVPIAGGYRDSESSHATAMTGIIAASGVGEPAARGTVPAVDVHNYLFAYDYFEPDEMVASESALHGWRVANHSYGRGWPCSPPTEEPCKSDPRWSSYIPDARSTDIWTRDSGVLSVYSAGNDGLQKDASYPGYLNDNWQTIHSGGVAKNALSVCAARPSSSPTVPFTIKRDSSKGPTSDGRVKPDLCALGERLSPDERTITTELGGGYRETYATSPAAAEVTGAVAALQDQYARMFPGDPNLPPALARGLLLHGARDIESNAGRWNGELGHHDPAHTSSGPDYTTGWGFMDLGASFELLVSGAWLRDGVAAGRQVDYAIGPVAPGEELRVTLVWDDPAATPGTGRALVNQLDLRVTDLHTGEIFRPYALDWSQPWLPAERRINSVDNVEQIRIVNETDEDAHYLVEVVGSSLMTRSQDYVLVSAQGLERARVIDEHRLRHPYEVGWLGNLACMGLLLRGPDIELARRVTVSSKTLAKPVTTPFFTLAKGDLDVIPRGVAAEGADEAWAKLFDQLAASDPQQGLVLEQDRDAISDQDVPLALELRELEQQPVRLELAAHELGWH